MLRYLAGRLLRAVLTIFLVITFAFFVLHLSGDPAMMILSADAPPESIKAYEVGEKTELSYYHTFPNSENFGQASFESFVGASGLSYEEAAEVCNAAVGTIKSRVNRARAKLAELLNITGAEDIGADRRNAGVELGEPWR